MIIWSIVMAVVIFMVEARHGAHHDALWVGFGATALFGCLPRGPPPPRGRVRRAVRQLDGRVGAPVDRRHGPRRILSRARRRPLLGHDRLGDHRGLEFATLFVVGSFFRLLRGSSGSATAA
jgi:hypothetical protein